MLIPESVNYGWFYVSESKRQNSKPYPPILPRLCEPPRFLGTQSYY